jgi:hypothetical protein
MRMLGAKPGAAMVLPFGNMPNKELPEPLILA